MSPRKRQRAKSEASVQATLAAALELFSRQGYRSTTIRQIAVLAGLSSGNVYHHFPNKEAIYQQLISVYWDRLLDPELPLNRIFAQARFPEDLEKIAEAIEQVVEENADNILLIYVDVVEFQGKHIRAFYESMAERFRANYAEVLKVQQERGEIGQVDPMVGVMVATRWFFYFFTVEKCFGVPMHLGLTPREAVSEFIRLIRYGLLPRSESASGE